MVKKLIEGLLKRKDGGRPEESAVPDELPALGEDSAQPQAPQAKSEESDEPPEELPGLEEPKPEVVQVRHVTLSQAPQGSARQSEPDEKEAPLEDEPADEFKEPPAPSSDGFFAGLSDMLKAGRPMDSIISHDLLSNMKENWGIRAESSKTGLSNIEEKRLANSINEILTQLRLMEGKWRAHKMILQEYEKLSHEQEEKIREKEKELKSYVRRFKVYQRVPDEKVIMLKDSIPVRSLSDLINALRTVDQSTFNTHVNGRRNDFSRFALQIDSRLGQDLKKATAKGEMVRILEAFVKKQSE